ncbi:hypothetical protein BMG00_17025 [Thioclava marina]|uniref:Lipoprotein n=1 Tax=Thioclava marina TaxID=1915077 RepID=A0ABX3MJ67_9RHOB|nr:MULTISPECIES: hypothetical protein [Thioclava]OOY11417.1 hypothetical protein BMG00_17025 [Thioclava marina]OOY26717.1 hypothetical protein BMI90_16160 [Thioclava sp. L04-15]
MENNLTRRAVSLLLPFGFLGITGCAFGPRASYAPRLPTDARFQEMVKHAMPDYRLTSAIIGRPVVRSPGFALLLVNIHDDPQTVLRKFLSQFEGTGLPQVKLYIDGVPLISQTWRVDFPGCEPGQCVATMERLRFVPISKAEHDRYRADRSGFGFERHTIKTATLDGVAYEAVVVVGYDYRHRVISYFVETDRAAINERERDWAVLNARRNLKYPIEVFRYSRNLALGVSAFYDDGPHIGGELSKGL